MKFIRVLKAEKLEKYIVKWVDYEDHSHTNSFIAKNDLDACRKVIDKVYAYYEDIDVDVEDENVTEEEILNEYPKSIEEYARYFDVSAEEDYVKEIKTASGRVVFKYGTTFKKKKEQKPNIDQLIESKNIDELKDLIYDHKIKKSSPYFKIALEIISEDKKYLGAFLKNLVSDEIIKIDSPEFDYLFKKSLKCPLDYNYYDISFLLWDIKEDSPYFKDLFNYALNSAIKKKDFKVFHKFFVEDWTRNSPHFDKTMEALIKYNKGKISTSTLDENLVDVGILTQEEYNKYKKNII